MQYNCFCNSHLIKSLHPLKGAGAGTSRRDPPGQRGQRLKEQMTVLIKNGTVVDPASGLHEVRDLWIDGDRIAEPAAHADQVIDASGKIVCPGFLDIHMHEDSVDAEGKLESYDEKSVFACMLHMGVTTAVAGNCG